MKQAVWRGMPYFDLFWRKRHLTHRELRAIYANYYTYVFWFLVISLVVLLDLHGLAERVSIAALIVYTFSLAVVTVALYVFATVIGMQLSQKYSWFFIICPLVGFVSITIATYIVELGISGYFGGDISLERAAEKLPVNMILTLVIETLYITFVLPIAVNFGDIKNNQASPNNENACVTLTIAGKTLFCNRLLSVSSQDHYVRIKTQDGEKLMRARLSDLIGQLDCQNGIQPHRSHWVSHRAVVGMVNLNGQKYLKLLDGSKLPIARGRMVDVQEWLENRRY